jgi:NADPH-dependent 2,4-dienoyl-CoA reductase/sulfur reductase-like enzyme
MPARGLAFCKDGFIPQGEGMRYVVIGSGVAAVSASDAIRSIDGENEIILVSDDPYGYYSRPGLAYFLTGELNERTLYPRTSDDLRRLKYLFLRGHVKSIQANSHTLEIAHRNDLSYDKLLVAVGAQAVSLEVPGANLSGVFKLDHMEDAKRILKSIHRGRTAVVTGGGITALELAEGLLARGMIVHYLLRGDRYWSNVLDHQESRIVETRLKKEGVTLHHHAEIMEVMSKNGHIHEIRLQNGETLRCDLLAYAIGIRPRLELARQAGLAVDRGILVNEFLQSSEDDIYAAGDVAQAYDPMTGRSVLDSLWNPARQQGYVAGLNMAGKRTTYTKSVPFNVTRLAGLTTTIIGFVGRGRDDDLVGIARGDSETWRDLPEALIAQSGFEVNRVRVMIGEKELIGAIVMGDQKLSMPLEKMISAKMDITPIRDQLLAPDARIGDLITDFWTNHNSSD